MLFHIRLTNCVYSNTKKIFTCNTYTMFEIIHTTYIMSYLSPFARMKISGEVPSLGLKLSDRKLHDMLMLVQSIPLPPSDAVENQAAVVYELHRRQSQFL